MTTVTDLFNEYDETVSGALQKIEDLQNEIECEKNNLQERVAKHLIATPRETINTQMLTSKFGMDGASSIICSVLDSRTLLDDDIDDEFLFLLERGEENSDLGQKFEATFNSLSNQKRLDISLFCSGLCQLVKKFKYMEDFLIKEYNIHANYSAEKNYISVMNYNYKTYRGVPQIQTERNHFDGLDEMAENLAQLMEDDYKNDNINVFSQDGSVTLRVRNKDGEIQIPTVETGRLSTDTFVGKGETLKEQFYSTLEYISKNYWYSNGDD